MASDRRHDDGRHVEFRISQTPITALSGGEGFLEAGIQRHRDKRLAFTVAREKSWSAL